MTDTKDFDGDVARAVSASRVRDDAPSGAAAGGPAAATVAVVGAGVSGLMAAVTLRDVYGIKDVVVLEAADYVGGRIKQLKGWVKNKEVEIGAEFLHGSTTLLTQLAHEQHWPLWQIFTWSQGDGGPSDEAAPDGGCGYYYIGAERKLMRFDALDDDMEHLHDVLDGLCDLTVDATDTRTIQQYLRDSGVAERVMSLACAGFGNTMGSTIDQLPLQIVASFEAQWDDDGDHDYRMEPSFGRMIRHLAKGLNIVTGWRVASVCSHSADGPVRLTSYDGRSCLVQRAIVTTSLEVLKQQHIQFCPHLGLTKQSAMKQLHVANGIKVLIRFSQRVWPRDCHGIIAADCFLPEMWFNQSTTPATPDRDARKPEDEQFYCTGFAMHTRADQVAALAESEIFNRTLDQLATMFGGLGLPSPRTHMIDAKFFEWKREPFVLGAYTTPTPHERPWMRQAYAAPHAHTVFFAGDAVAGARPAVDCPQTVHGSMLTGKWAADDVAASLGQTPVPPSRL